MIHGNAGDLSDNFVRRGIDQMKFPTARVGLKNPLQADGRSKRHHHQDYR
jgi:hypothetical protein